MLIGKKYKLEADNLNYVLYKKRTGKRKDTDEPFEDWDFVGYFSSVANALHELVEQGVRDTKLTDMRIIETKLGKLHALINSLKLERPPETPERSTEAIGTRTGNLPLATWFEERGVKTCP